MRLADFIVRNMEAILRDWEEFASSLMPAAASMTSLALRDHAKQILQAVAKDLSAPQTETARAEKSKGLAPKQVSAPETAAETHAVLRARSGFNINQLAAEYRALRASVLRQWLGACQPQAPHIDDIIRFNEAIDQALIESIAFFNAKVEQSRNLLLGMIGHDLRSPLQAIRMTAAQLARLNAGETVSEAASRVIRSGARMQALLDDLVEFNRTQLGLGIRITPTSADLATVFSDELEELRAAHPNRQLHLAVTGDTQGMWDGRRLQQVLGNLVLNAIKHGATGTPIQVAVSGKDSDVRFEVRNTGPAIAQSVLNRIFDPLMHARGHEHRGAADGSLGLGLYIAREIVRAHRGEIEARSENAETVFAVRLPRELA